MKDKVYLNKRKWLNPVGHWNTGALAYKVTRDQYSVDSELSIWDCSKKITLDLCVTDSESAKQVAKKIDTLLLSLTEIRQGIGKAYDDLLNDPEYNQEDE